MTHVIVLIISYYNLYKSVCWLWRPPCQAPCHRGRACRGFRNRASPVDYLDGDDHVAGGEDVDGDDNDNDLDVKKSHFHHRERICSCEITLGQKSVKEIENLIYNWSSPFILTLHHHYDHDHHHHDHEHPHLGVPIRLWRLHLIGGELVTAVDLHGDGDDHDDEGDDDGDDDGGEPALCCRWYLLVGQISSFSLQEQPPEKYVSLLHPSVTLKQKIRF